MEGGLWSLCPDGANGDPWREHRALGTASVVYQAEADRGNRRGREDPHQPSDHRAQGRSHSERQPARAEGRASLRRPGGLGKLFTAVPAPSPLGSFLRSFTFGHVRQLDAVASRALIGLAETVPGLPDGGDGLGTLDTTDTVRGRSCHG